MSGPLDQEYERRPLAPTDREAEAAYDRLMKEAAEYGLVVQAYGGVATLAIPEEQRKAGIRRRVLDAILRREAPGCASTPS